MGGKRDTSVGPRSVSYLACSSISLTNSKSLRIQLTEPACVIKAMGSEQVSTGHAYSKLTETGLFFKKKKKKLVSFDHKFGRRLRKSIRRRTAEVFLFAISLDRRLLAGKVELSNDPGKTVRTLGLSGIFL